jgi:hypothetical protein
LYASTSDGVCALTMLAMGPAVPDKVVKMSINCHRKITMESPLMLVNTIDGLSYWVV